VFTLASTAETPDRTDLSSQFTKRDFKDYRASLAQ